LIQSEGPATDRNDIDVHRPTADNVEQLEGSAAHDHDGHLVPMCSEQLAQSCEEQLEFITGEGILHGHKIGLLKPSIKAFT
jgi:hypothetical protein